jgi:hypothetical protein
MSSNFTHLYKSSVSLAGSEEVPFLFAPHMLKTRMTPETNVGSYHHHLNVSMRGRLVNGYERTVIFGVVANGHLFRRASATWLEARAALAQITNAEKDKELSFRKVGMNGRWIVI